MYVIHNNSTGVATVQSSGLNTIYAIPAGVSVQFTCILTSGTTAASWDYELYGAGTLTGAGAIVLSDSPTFTGVPAAPTAAVDTNTTQLATTAYVIGQSYLKSATAASTYAPLASPALTGTPTAPTAAANTNTTQIATTAFVIGQGYVTSSALSTYAPLASPTFTGKVTTAASTTGSAGLNLPAGTSPTSPTNGDVWTTATGAFIQIGGTTQQITTSVSSPTTTTVSANTATTVDTLALSAFTAVQYLIVLKQGSIVRTSTVVMQTDGTNVDSLEYAINETNGTMSGVVVAGVVSGSNAVLQVTVTNAASSPVTVKFLRTGTVTTSFTVNTNVATTVDTNALANFTTIQYLVILKQGTLIRASNLLVQTDGTNVDSLEYGINETNGSMAGVVVAGVASGSNEVLQVTVTNAATTPVTVNFTKTIF
jgi:hypothetical protein